MRNKCLPKLNSKNYIINHIITESRQSFGIFSPGCYFYTIEDELFAANDLKAEQTTISVSSRQLSSANQHSVQRHYDLFLNPSSIALLLYEVIILNTATPGKRRCRWLYSNFVIVTNSTFLLSCIYYNRHMIVFKVFGFTFDFMYWL